MRIQLLTLFSLLSFYQLITAQTPYTSATFQYDSILNVTYGTAVDYAGNNQVLTLDIYKPVNDYNCNRPLLIVVHGGAWIAGSKEDVNCVAICKEMAKKGWVAATINYRLGTHKASNYTMYALCNNSLSQPCGYISDSSEIVRANYRGMQDAKGAIRYMKSRSSIDSTDINNTFICGESAGGFISLSAAYMDIAPEKPSDCLAISPAPNPASSLNPYGCIPSSNSLSRPDLGDIEGNISSGTYNATVQGVGSFYGGLLDLSILPTSANSPVLYQFHQGADVVVHYNSGKLLGRVSWECYQPTNLCQPYYFYPNAFGGKAIANYLTSINASISRDMQIVENYSYGNNCFSNGHSIDNLTQRVNEMATLFANRIAANGNLPSSNCTPSSLNELQNYPILINPVVDNQIDLLPGNNFNTYHLFDYTGQLITEGQIETTHITLPKNCKAGSYYLHLVGESVRKSITLVVFPN